MKKTEISPGKLEQNIFKNQKCLTKYLRKFFCFMGYPQKRHFQWAFDKNVFVNVIRVFIKQIFRAAVKAQNTYRHEKNVQKIAVSGPVVKPFIC
jgi:hypothetical protein